MEHENPADAAGFFFVRRNIHLAARRNGYAGPGRHAARWALELRHIGPVAPQISLAETGTPVTRATRRIGYAFAVVRSDRGCGQAVGNVIHADSGTKAPLAAASTRPDDVRAETGTLQISVPHSGNTQNRVRSAIPPHVYASVYGLTTRKRCAETGTPRGERRRFTVVYSERWLGWKRRVYVYVVMTAQDAPGKPTQK